jgi:hypothetical protein
MHSWEALPQSSLIVTGPVSTEIVARGILDFRASGRYLHSLPYGRTADRTDFFAVLHEGRGTCSTKHALLAALAQEQSLPVKLTLGIYEMHERNTPGVGAVLAQYSLSSLPEAHCYLMYEGRRIDITRSGVEPAELIAQFLHEEIITPEQIGEYKVALHRRVMQDWVMNNPALVKGRNFEEVWQIREACITVLAQ